jgi:hypothetical protein
MDSMMAPLLLLLLEVLPADWLLLPECWWLLPAELLVELCPLELEAAWRRFLLFSSLFGLEWAVVCLAVGSG